MSITNRARYVPLNSGALAERIFMQITALIPRRLISPCNEPAVLTLSLRMAEKRDKRVINER